jgi:hypothetical protein
VITAITLVDPDRGLSSVVMPRTGIAWQGLDVVAAVRAQTDARVGGHGAIDSTLYADAAAVTLTLHLMYPVRALLDELGQFCNPAARPYLVVSDDEWDGDRQVRLRFTTTAKPIALGQGLDRDAQYQWVAPDGLWVDTVQQEADIPASAASTTGLDFTATTGMDVKPTTGIDFPASTTAADSLVTVGGDVAPPWVARLYGPCTGPKLYNDTAGGQGVVFLDGLVLAAGQYVELNSRDRTANLLSDPGQPQLAFLDFAHTTWWDLVAGAVNSIRYVPSAIGGGGAIAQLLFNPARMP